MRFHPLIAGSSAGGDSELIFQATFEFSGKTCRRIFRMRLFMRKVAVSKRKPDPDHKIIPNSTIIRACRQLRPPYSCPLANSEPSARDASTVIIFVFQRKESQMASESFFITLRLCFSCLLSKPFKRQHY